MYAVSPLHKPRVHAKELPLVSSQVFTALNLAGYILFIYPLE